MHVRIVGVPLSEAPEDVRRAWVGMVLPLDEGETGPRAVSGFGVVSGRPRADAQGYYRRTLQYLVPAGVAVDLLEQNDPQAAAWWRENAPHTIAPGMQFAFDADVCQSVESGSEGGNEGHLRPPEPHPVLLEVNYTTTAEDYRVWAEHHRRKQWAEAAANSGPAWVRYVALSVLPSFALLLVIGWSLFDLGNRALFLILAAPLFVFVGVFPPVYWWWGLWRARRAYRAAAADTAEAMLAAGSLGRTTLEATADALAVRCGGGAEGGRWADMAGVDVVGDHTFIYVVPEAVAIVPYYGFDREEDYAAVRDLALSKIGSRS